MRYPQYGILYNAKQKTQNLTKTNHIPTQSPTVRTQCTKNMVRFRLGNWKMRQVCLLLLGLILGPWGAWGEDGESVNPDLGPEDPGFVANTGELESEVNPQQKPKGNYHIIQV